MPSKKATMLALNKQSIAIIRNNKKMLVFPIINYILTFSLFLIALIPLAKMEKSAWETHHVAAKTYFIFFAILILYFFLYHLINTMFNAALTQCAINHMQQKSYTIRTGFLAIYKHARLLFLWKIIMTTLGPVIRFLEYWVDDWSKTSKIAALLLSRLRWKSATLFVIPVLINENLGPWRSIRRSSQLVHDHWGIKALFRGRISFTGGLLYALAFFPLFISLFMSTKIDIITASTISMLLFLGVSIVHSTSQIILVSALYLYTIDVDTTPYFDVDLLKNAL